MQKNSLIITVLVAIIALGVGTFAGVEYQKMQRPTFGNGQFLGRGNGGFGGRFGQNGGGAPVIGKITSTSDNSITVQLQDGSSKIIILSGSTSINKQATGSKSDLTSGTNVLIIGSANSDGSITAQNIQLNPMMRRFGPNPSSTTAPK